MGFLDKLLGRNKQTSEGYQSLSGHLNLQSDEDQDAARARMEAELQESKKQREATARK